MYRILISGYYGFNNIGDESILRTVIDNLQDKLPDVHITVLSQSPRQTAVQFGVSAAHRMKPLSILRELLRCDLLLSGGGSLLQDATSKRSILYYLAILRLAQLMGKKTFIYSQGIGPISLPRNRRLTAAVLKRADGIVVRDEKSGHLLQEIGISPQSIHVTADPVIRSKKPPLTLGELILEQEGCPLRSGKMLIGWAVKSRKPNPQLIQELRRCILWLKETYDADSVLIPFFHGEDAQVCEAIAEGMEGQVCCLRRKYLSEEMLSIIGCMDVLVGVRLHSLIYAAVMGTPMLGISYDPKVDSFLASLGQEALSTVEDFSLETFQQGFVQLMEQREAIAQTTAQRLEELVCRLHQNEELIRKLMEAK